jgi:hypothetical protein
MRISVVLISALGLCAQEPNTPNPTPPNKEAQGSEAKGMPPRATPAEYLSHAEAGAVTIAAEFMGHAVPTPEATLSTDDYVVVEVGIFGPPEARLQLSSSEFTLRINGKKPGKPLSREPYELVYHSLRDPQWQPPVTEESKSKTSIGTGGKGGLDTSSTPAPVKIPIELQRVMQQQVKRAALPEGNRLLPVAGLIFFEHRGKTENIHSMELIYEGAAGKATVALQP